MNSDYYQTTDYAAAGAALRALALGNCRARSRWSTGGSVDRAGGHDHRRRPAGGWTFAASTTTSGVTITPPRRRVTDVTGALSFALTFSGGTTSAQ